MGLKINKSSTKRLIALAWQEKSRFILGLIALGLGSGVNLLLPDLFRRVLDSEHLQETLAHPSNIGLMLIALFGFQSVCFYFRTLLFGEVGQRIVKDLRAKLYSNIIDQSVEFFDRSRAGDLVSRIGSDTSMLQDAVSIRLSVFIRYSIQVLAGIVMMLLISIKLSLLILLGLPVLVTISIILGKRLKFHSKDQQATLGEAITVAEQTFSGIRVIKAFNGAGAEKNRFAAYVDRALAIGLARNKISAFFQSFVSFLMNGFIVALVLYGTTLVSDGHLSVGQLTAFLLYGLIVAVSFSFVAGGYAEFMQSVGAAERIFEILDLAGDSASTTGFQATFNDAIQFSNVSFSYPSRPEALALNNVSLELPAGKVTALVGPSGSGKSTIVSLILKFYPATKGNIKVDGVDIGLIDSVSLRSNMALVPQDALLLGISIAENLRYGKPSASDEELWSACRQANLEEFVQSLPEKLNTRVGERGVQLSGGERQRMAIARALLRNPKLLILDEATSSLDSRNEFMVQEALTKLMKGRTCLVIAHRLSTIKAADQIFVMDSGRIVQSGSHDSLSNESGLYRELVEKQLLSASAEPLAV